MLYISSPRNNPSFRMSSIKVNACSVDVNQNYLKVVHLVMNAIYTPIYSLGALTNVFSSRVSLSHRIYNFLRSSLYILHCLIFPHARKRLHTRNRPARGGFLV